MLPEKELQEIRDILSKASNPFYLFDDDGDGLCAYLLLKKHYKKGKGVAIKKAGPLDLTYVKQIEEEKADLVVILDKAVVTQEFIHAVPCKVLYIDHHPVQDLKHVLYFNPLMHDPKSYIPTSEIVYSVVKDNIWIATVGCLFDYKIPYFIKDFKKEYPKLVPKLSKDPGYFKFDTEIGKLVKIFNFSLKGNFKYGKKAIAILEKVESPYEILNQTTEEGKYLYNRYEHLNKHFESLLERAKKYAKDKFLVFNYVADETSFSSDLATELSYRFKDKTIIIGREKGNEMKLSMRNQKKDLAKILPKALEGLDGYGGGHPHAVGGMVPRYNFDIFIERMKKLVK